MHYSDLNNAIGNTDIYLLDQILKGRFDGRNRIFDAGCGEGRNLRYFAGNGYDIYGLDTNPMAVKMLQMMYSSFPKDNFLTGSLEELPWKDHFFDAIICSAVLHFATDQDHFRQMVLELVRVLNMKGLLFIRMASVAVGLNDTTNAYTYLLTPDDVLWLQSRSGLTKLEPVKTVLVESHRAMTTLVMEK